MAKRLFLIYALVEIAVLALLVATIGFGHTVLLVAASFLIGLVLAGSQLRRYLRQLRAGLSDPHAALSDSMLMALGTALVVIPGLASSALGVLLLLPPTRAAARPVVTTLLARQVPIVLTTSTGFGAAPGTAGHRYGAGDYIDGEVIDVTDATDVVDPYRLPPKA